MPEGRDSTTPLGVFLRARREQIRPEQAGLPDLGRRRVPGLRREELAMLAGVSVDYYVRLEQGRNDHPSVQVLDALARVLQLDDDTTVYLHELAAPAPARPRRQAKVKSERLSPVIERLFSTLTIQPAFVLGRYMDVLASTPLMQAVSAGHCVSRNVVKAAFLDPATKDFYPDWDAVADETVATLRASVGTDLDDPNLVQLIGELSIASDDFRQRWARHDVRLKTSGTKRMMHPLVGELTVDYESLAVMSAPGQMLILYSPTPGTPTAERIDMLAGLIAPEVSAR